MFNYLDDFYIAYLDNILIYLENKLDYKEYIKKVLQQLQDTSLQTNLKKYKFRVKYIKYLGFIITTDSIEVNLEKVSAVVN